MCLLNVDLFELNSAVNDDKYFFYSYPWLIQQVLKNCNLTRNVWFNTLDLFFFVSVFAMFVVGLLFVCIPSMSDPIHFEQGIHGSITKMGALITNDGSRDSKHAK